MTKLQDLVDMVWNDYQSKDPRSLTSIYDVMESQYIVYFFNETNLNPLIAYAENNGIAYETDNKKKIVYNLSAKDVGNRGIKRHTKPYPLDKKIESRPITPENHKILKPKKKIEKEELEKMMDEIEGK